MTEPPPETDDPGRIVPDSAAPEPSPIETSAAAAEGHRAHGHAEEPKWLKAWYGRALMSGLTGLVLSALFSALVVLGLTFNWPGFRALERVGVDASMKAFVQLAEFMDRPEPKKAQKLLFIDVDEAACLRFSKTKEACQVDQPVPTALLVAIAQAAKKTEASVIMIDVAPPEDPKDRQALYAALSTDAAKPAQTGPWFIAPAWTRSADADNSAMVMTNPATDHPSPAGRLRFAAFSTFGDPQAGDGVIRHYPLAVAKRAPGEKESSGWLPSAPFLAYLLLDSCHAAMADCFFFPGSGRACSRSDIDAAARFMTRYDLGPEPDPHVALNRIFYSLPSLAQLSRTLPPDASKAPGACRSESPIHYHGRYERICASDQLAPEAPAFDFNPNLFKGRIVVVGNGSATGRDLHSTPIGVMSGPEILLNATRTLTDFAPLRQQDNSGAMITRLGPALQTFGTKLISGMFGAAIMTAAWGFIYLTLRTPQIPSFMKQVLCLMFFTGGMSLVAWLEIAHMAGELKEAPETGQLVDFLLPILVLGVEGYTHVAHLLMEGIEGVLSAIATWMTRISVALFSKPKSSEPGT